ncbi:MAG: HAD family phosphatase, partial [Anaerolineae bacterium]|nr:HAD family phosphatase [Anaerolineae bacterium]
MNIVFDFGGVIFTWNSRELVAKHFNGQELCDKVYKAVFGHPDWAEVDRGTMTLDEVTRNSARRTGLPEADLARLIYGAAEALVPIPESLDLVK